MGYQDTVSTPGARHLAESGVWLADQNEPVPIAPEPEQETVAAVAPLFEVAACHDGQPALSWLHMFYQQYCGRFTV